LAENAQEFIFVHIPKNIWEITPSNKKKLAVPLFFLGATPMYKTMPSAKKKWSY
jgi:hypothetical protein